MRTKKNTLRKQKGRAYGYEFKDVEDACLQLARANVSEDALNIFRDASRKFHPDRGGTTEQFQQLQKCSYDFWPHNRNPRPANLDNLIPIAEAKREKYKQEHQPQEPAPAAEQPPAPPVPQFPIKCMVFKSQGAVEFGDLTKIQTNGKFKIGNANYDPNTVQPTVKDPRFAKISDWRKWLLDSRQVGGSTRGHRLPSLPTRRARRFSSSKKRRYSHRRRALQTGKVGYRPTKTGRKV